MRTTSLLCCLFAIACGSGEDPVDPTRDTGRTSARFDAGDAQAVCGNGTVEAGEDCDDGNRFNDDGRSNTCQRANCGDGQVNPLEEDCDDGKLRTPMGAETTAAMRAAVTGSRARTCRPTRSALRPAMTATPSRPTPAYPAAKRRRRRHHRTDRAR